MQLSFSASSYELRYVIDNLTQLRDDFESCPMIDVEDLFNFTNPADAGSIESLQFEPPEAENETFVL